MRVVLAAIFVFAGMLAVLAILSATGGFDSLPPPALNAISAISFIGSLVAALWLFNRKPLNLLGLKTAEEQLSELEAAGMIAETHFAATRAFEVAEADDEGPHYFLALGDGAVLYITGQALYDYVEITDDPQFNQPRRFPCTDFTVRRHKLDGYILELDCRGEVIEPERVGPSFSRDAWRNHRVPKDGEIIRDRSFEALMTEFSRGGPRST